MNQRLTNLLTRVTELTDNKNKLANDIIKDLAEPEINRLSERRKEKQRELNSQLQEATASFNYLRQTTNQSLKSFQQKINKRQSDSQKEVIASLQSTINHLQDQNEQLRNNLNRKEQQIQELIQTLGERENALERKKSDDMNTIRSQLSKVNQDLKQMREQNEDLKNAMLQMKRELDFSQAAKKLQKIIQDAIDKMLKPEALRMKQLQDQSNHLSSQIYNMCATIARQAGIQTFPRENLSKELPAFTKELLMTLITTQFMPETEVILGKQMKYWLFDELRNDLNGGEKIITKLLYKFSKAQYLTKGKLINFHFYIDKKPNLLIIVKLANGMIVGAFTKYPIDKDHIEKPGYGFLFNANNQAIYPVRRDPFTSVVAYDDYYIFLGNAEFRLKSQQVQFFSNFGIANSTFDSKGQKRMDFMGVEETTTTLDMYEIHEIIY